jgi:predicted  nucleic acid-binding Zn-ribbon protein
MAELQKVLQHLEESNGALRHHVMQMAQELGKRDQEAQAREIQHRNAILALQSNMNALKSQMNATQKELQETRQMITSRASGDADKDSEPQESINYGRRCRNSLSWSASCTRTRP